LKGTTSTETDTWPTALELQYAAYFAAAQAQAVKLWPESWSMEQAYCGHANWSNEDRSPGK
jgi:hypothetical protein